MHDVLYFAFSLGMGITFTLFFENTDNTAFAAFELDGFVEGGLVGKETGSNIVTDDADHFTAG